MLTTVAALVFGPWQTVTVAQILEPVPEWVERSRSYAAPEPNNRPLPEFCAIRDDQGYVVGYRLGCEVQP